MSMTDISFRIERMRPQSDIKLTLDLFTAYARSLDIDLAFQDFQGELASFPGNYASPGGIVLIGRSIHGEPLGCVALRPLSQAGSCEMKRLWVAPGGRELGLGKALIIAIIEEAERIGYSTMKLDTLPTMTKAIGLYKTHGFAVTEAYYDTPIAGTVFMERSLKPK